VTAEPHDVVITDLLGNVTHWYAQVDGTLTMPFKRKGKYHCEGATNLKSLIDSMKPALLKNKKKMAFALLIALFRAGTLTPLT